MKLYYAGPQHLAGPVIEGAPNPSKVETPIRVLFGNVAGSRQSTEAVLERCVRHHLRSGNPIMFSNPARPLAAYQARLGRRREPDPAQVNAILQQCASELVAFMRITAHPTYSGSAALFVRDPALLLGLGSLSYSVIPSLGAYLGYASALGVACYVACDEVNTLPNILRNALERARAVVREASGNDPSDEQAKTENPEIVREPAIYERRPA